MNNPIDIILDTDIGMDCDDAVALGVLIKAQNDGRCAIRAITAATAREGAISCVRSILGYYGAPEPVLGKLESTFLKCDYVNYYAKAASDKFGFPDDADDAVKVLRRTLATSPAKITLITIGPLTDIADLLRSGADEISPLSGAELMREKVDKVYAMAGSFAGNYADGNAFREWNVLQDIESARVFCERCPAPVVFLPHEVGNKIFVDQPAAENPITFCMRTFCEEWAKKPADGFRRESWDPVTCMIALDENDKKFVYSDYGKIAVNPDGMTVFTPDPNGKDRYVSVKSDLSAIENELNGMLK